MTLLTRGQLAKASGLNAETIRFYDKEGLLPTPSRSQAGYRQYSPDCIQRLVFIKQTQALGFSLAEIRELLTLKDKPDASQRDVKKLITEKRLQIQAKMIALQDIDTMLGELDAQCDGTGETSSCQILNQLSQPSHCSTH
jgi:MerR family transcriptional regulator, copper efflux regulator